MYDTCLSLNFFPLGLKVLDYRASTSENAEILAEKKSEWSTHFVENE